MNKRTSHFLLALFLCLVLPMTAAAQETSAEKAPRFLPISTLEQFLTFVENCRLDSYSENLQVTLHADLDLTGVSFSGVPVFCGSFDGQGHTISGLSITEDGSNLGLFRYLSKEARVQRLHVEGTVSPKGSQGTIGGIAGNNAGRILDCSFSGIVSGGDYIGGIAGVNSVSGIVESCTVEGTVAGKHFLGGIAGSNSGVIRDCSNLALVNTTAKQNNVKLSDITLDSVRSSEAINTVTDIGGIAGVNGGVIRDCENKADVGYLSMGYNVGGIAGSQMGYVTDCLNSGSIRGRKEIGGIIGQMEPVTNIEYSEDTLQILQKQLSGMASLTTRASSHMQSGASEASGQIASMQDSIYNAYESIGMILSDWADSGFDPDSIVAAQGNLNRSLQEIQSGASGVASAIHGTVGTLAADLRAITGQIGAMQETLDRARDHLGGTITDISDMDTPDNLTGKVSFCRNTGTVNADRNAGGIAGAIAPENDLDAGEDLNILGEQSLNFDSELRSVILSCDNTATVTVNKQNAGGIVGWMPMGLVKNCLNTGAIDAESAEYVGGVAGSSSGFIRQCYAKCRVDGDDYVGGIAGTADTLSDCRSLVFLTGKERTGSILGFVELTRLTVSEEDEEETEDPKPPVSGNLYCTTSGDLGAIDGISYSGCAEKLPLADFLSLEKLPQEMKRYSVRFRFPDGQEKVYQLTPGTDLKEAYIPYLPMVDGCTGRWDGLNSLTVAFDTTFEAVYDPLCTVLESENKAGDLPMVLAEGAFFPETTLSAEETDLRPPLSDGLAFISTVEIRLPKSQDGHRIHLHIPEDVHSDKLGILYQADGGDWESISYSLVGSYAVFSGVEGLQRVAFVEKEAGIPMRWFFLLGIPMLACGLLLIRRFRKKKRRVG